MPVMLVSNDGEVLRLQAMGRIVLSQSTDEPDPLKTLTGPDGYSRKVLLNLEQVSFVDSGGVGWLLASHKRFRKGGGILVLHTVPEAIQLTLKVLRLDSVLHIAENESAAFSMAVANGS